MSEDIAPRRVESIKISYGSRLKVVRVLFGHVILIAASAASRGRAGVTSAHIVFRSHTFAFLHIAIMCVA